MDQSLDELTAHLLNRLRLVQQNLGMATDSAASPQARFADLIDSMGLVEFAAVLAEDCGVPPAAVEASVKGNFGTIAELAQAMHSTGMRPQRPAEHAAIGTPQPSPMASKGSAASGPGAWLAATAVRLPATVQTAASMNEAIGRPPGWLENHAGIAQRRIWANEDPLQATAEAARDCLEQAGLKPRDISAVLVTSEAPPLLAGLAAALHYRLGLGPRVAALEVGGACTGFLAALWTAQALLPHTGAVLVIAVEAHSHHLLLEPGASGEAAALFGDAVAACLLCDRPAGAQSVALEDIVIGADGGLARLLRLERSAAGVMLRMEGVALASRAVRVMANGVREIAGRHGISLSDLAAVVAHGGNGRMPALLARQLDLPLDRIWSETAHTGNLGSASLPVAWAAHAPVPRGPFAWTAVGAGLTWGAALTGVTVRS